MISDARGSHVSPGIYTEERDVTYSVKSLGITSLGLVGETLYGPAFQDVEIENWGEYVDYFGGTSTSAAPTCLTRSSPFPAFMTTRNSSATTATIWSTTTAPLSTWQICPRITSTWICTAARRV